MAELENGPELAAHRSGLEGVIVAETSLSRVDGEQGRLVIRGWDLEQAAGTLQFEEMAQLLWQGEVGEPGIAAALGRARVAAFAQLDDLGGALESPDGMEALRASISHLSEEAGESGGPAQRGEAAEEGERVRIAAATAVFAAAWARVRGISGPSRGSAPIAPDPALSHAEDYLRMLTGERPAPERAAALDSYLCTVAEHGMNASTFAARVVASTGSDVVSSVVGALCALKGPLHGGAPGPVLDMLEEVGTAERARAWLEASLASGDRIMGLGHRVYRVRDPRAAVLEAAIEQLEAAGISTQRLALARAVEREAAALLRERHPDRPLEANVEFYTAVLLDTLGLDRRLFTPTFAVGRVAGWLAHIWEQRANGRLIRPSCRYVGPYPEAA